MKDLSMELIELIASKCQKSQDIASLSQVNRRFYASVTRLLYKHIILHGPRQYISFQGVVYGDLKSFVRILDFSSYTTRGSRWTEAKAKSLLVASEIASLIRACPNLQELYVGEEMMHAFVSPCVIKSIFNNKQQRNLETVDFTGFCDKKFTTVMSDFFGKPLPSKLKEPQPCTKVTTTATAEMIEEEDWSIPSKLKNISFYMCMALSEQQFFIPFFDKLSLSGNQLVQLDLAHTQITSQVFVSLEKSMSTITHLNLAGCHQLTCCSPLISFITQATQLQQFNLNMDFSGFACSKFCTQCLYTLMKSFSSALHTLDMGGHLNLNDELLKHVQQAPTNLQYLSISACKNISVNGLKHYLKGKKLQYLNVSKALTTTTTTMEIPRVLNELTNICDVIEISNTMGKDKLSPCIKEWKLIQQGRRFYYSKSGEDARFIYSKKLLFNDQLSPMNIYWAYSY